MPRRDLLGGLPRASLGAVYIEYLITLLPVLFAALSIWQLLELWTADLMLKRAASVAARAAAVVLPDDPAFYDDVPVHQFAGRRRTDIELSAALVLAASPQFTAKPEVRVQISPSEQFITATVTARFECFMSRLSLVCGSSLELLRAEASYPYQGARYVYATR